MAKMVTFCDECTYFHNDSKGCTLGFHDKFVSSGSEILEDDGRVYIERVCPHMRPHGSPPKDVYISGTIAVSINSLQEISEAIKKLLLLRRIDRFNVVFVYGHELRGVYKECSKLMDGNGIEFICTQCNKDADRYTESFKHAKNGYFFYVTSVSNIDVDMIDKVDFYVNKQLKILAKSVSDHLIVTNSLIEKTFKKYGVEIEDEYITQWETINEEYCSDL